MTKRFWFSGNNERPFDPLSRFPLSRFARAGDFKIGLPIGAPVKYGEEIVAYTLGHTAALRFHALPLVPFSALGSLNRGEKAVVGSVAIIAAYITHTTTGTETGTDQCWIGSDVYFRGV